MITVIKVRHRRYMDDPRTYHGKTRIYIHVAGDCRFDRPYKLYRTYMPYILAKLGLPAGTKASWSQRAGCSCGCSPGFVLQASPYAVAQAQGTSGTTDIFVTITGSADAKLKADANIEVMAGRL